MGHNIDTIHRHHVFLSIFELFLNMLSEHKGQIIRISSSFNNNSFIQVRQIRVFLLVDFGKIDSFA